MLKAHKKRPDDSVNYRMTYALEMFLWMKKFSLLSIEDTDEFYRREAARTTGFIALLYRS